MIVNRFNGLRSDTLLQGAPMFKHTSLRGGGLGF